MQFQKEHEEIINRIKDLRIKKGLSQAQFAKLIGASSGNVSSWEVYKSLPSAIALKNIALNLGCSLDWLVLGHTQGPDTNPSPQKNEVIFDPDLKMMIDVLKELMSNENPHMRSWVIIQFEKAFSETCAVYAEKKQA